MDYRIHPINGNRSMPAIEVFSKALKYLKDKLIDFIAQMTKGCKIRGSKDIKWVLTVPAIWKHGARHFMREAAYRVRIQCHMLSLVGGVNTISKNFVCKMSNGL